jgi:tetrahydromethanopterin S-methyltransferase subunit G
MRRNCAGVIGGVSHKWQCRRSASYATSATLLADSHKIVRESPYFTSALHSQDRRAEDDATMEDTVDKVAERLAQLEKTVAEGFFANSEQFKRAGGRFTSIEAHFNAMDLRLDALDHKIDISVESLRSDIKTVLDAVGAVAEEMRRTAAAIRKEGAADREVLKLALQDHTVRLQAIEEWRRSL